MENEIRKFKNRFQELRNQNSIEIELFFEKHNRDLQDEFFKNPSFKHSEFLKIHKNELSLILKN